VTYSRIKGTHTHTLIHLDSYVCALTIHHRLSSNDVNDEHKKSEKREDEEISSRNYHIPTKQQKFIHV
jgi:hypothetical protein